MYIDTKTVFLSNHVGTPVGLGHLSFTAVQHVTLKNCTLAISHSFYFPPFLVMSLHLFF